MSKVDAFTSTEDAPGAETLAVRAGQHRGPEREHSEPIYTTSSFVFENAAQAAALFQEQEEGNVYLEAEFAELDYVERATISSEN